MSRTAGISKPIKWATTPRWQYSVTCSVSPVFFLIVIFLWQHWPQQRCLLGKKFVAVQSQKPQRPRVVVQNLVAPEPVVDVREDVPQTLRVHQARDPPDRVGARLAPAHHPIPAFGNAQFGLQRVDASQAHGKHHEGAQENRGGGDLGLGPGIPQFAQLGAPVENLFDVAAEPGHHERAVLPAERLAFCSTRRSREACDISSSSSSTVLAFRTSRRASSSSSGGT